MAAAGRKGAASRSEYQYDGVERHMAQTLEGEEYLTVEEACAVLEVKAATLYAYVSRGKLRSYRQGIHRQRLYKRSEVEALARLGPSRHVNLPLVDPWSDMH